MKNRYYIQHLTEQIFIVREHLSANGTPEADDRIVRSFTILHDAYQYASSMNEAQKIPQNSSTAPEDGKQPEASHQSAPGQTRSLGQDMASPKKTALNQRKRQLERKLQTRQTPPRKQHTGQTVSPTASRTNRTLANEEQRPLF